MLLQAKLREARERRGVTLSRAVRNMPNVSSRNTLRTLEGGNPERSPKPGDVSLAVAIDVIAAYWPDIQLEDFLPDAPFKLLVGSRQGRAHINRVQRFECEGEAA